MNEKEWRGGKRDRPKRKKRARSVENITEIEVPNWKRQTLSQAAELWGHVSHSLSLTQTDRERVCVFMCVSWFEILLYLIRAATSLHLTSVCFMCICVCERGKGCKDKRESKKEEYLWGDENHNKRWKTREAQWGSNKRCHDTERVRERELVTYQEATIIHTLREVQGLYHRVYSSDKTHTSVTKSKGFSEKLSIRVSCTPIFSYSLTCFVLPTRYIFKIGSWPSAFEGNYHLFFFTNITRLNSTSTDIAGRLDWGCDRDASPTQNDSVRMRLNHHYLSGVLTNSSNKSCCFYL